MWIFMDSLCVMMVGFSLIEVLVLLVILSLFVFVVFMNFMLLVDEWCMDFIYVVVENVFE